MSAGLLREHRQYLSDHARNLAYERAIRETVGNGDSVVDLGSGSGVMGLLCCRHGAARVYAIDESPAVELCRATYGDNGYSDRVQFFNRNSKEVELPHRVNGVIADQAGIALGLRGALVQCFYDARKRFLVPGGWLIPNRLVVSAALVESEELWDDVGFWSTPRCGFDFSAVQRIAANVTTQCDLSTSPGLLISEPAECVAIELGTAHPETVTATVEMRATRSGIVHGICAWFALQLSKNVSITNSPVDSNRFDRKQLFLPLSRSLNVERGSTLEVEWRVNLDSQVTSWIVTSKGVGTSDPVVLKHSTFFGNLRTDAERMRAHPRFRPQRSRHGDASQAVLALCDGRHDVAEIESIIFDGYRDLFNSLSNAQSFVALVLDKECGHSMANGPLTR